MQHVCLDFQLIKTAETNIDLGQVSDVVERGWAASRIGTSVSLRFYFHNGRLYYLRLPGPQITKPSGRCNGSYVTIG